MTAIFGILAFILLLCAITGVVPMRLWSIPQGLQMLLWAFSFIGQCFALPLAIISAVLLLLSLWYDPPTLAITGFSVALLLFIIIHARLHGAGKRLLAIASQEKPSPPDEPVSWLSGLMPSRGHIDGVKRIPNLSYGDAGNGRNLLDVFVPESPPGEPMPVIFHIHGGAWIMGEKEQQGQPLLYYLASKGWLGVSINYRLGPKFRFPDMFTDVLRAIAWIKANAAQYGGNPDFIAVTGGSAGGHLTSLCALMPNNPRFKPGFENTDTSISAAIPVYGRFDFLDRFHDLGKGRELSLKFFTDNVMPSTPEQDPELWELASPFAQVNANAPPFFVISSRHDTLIPYGEGRHFADALREKSHNIVLHAELAIGQHAYDILTNPLTDYHNRAIERFLNGVLSDAVREERGP